MRGRENGSNESVEKQKCIYRQPDEERPQEVLHPLHSLICYICLYKVHSGDGFRGLEAQQPLECSVVTLALNICALMCSLCFGDHETLIFVSSARNKWSATLHCTPSAVYQQTAAVGKKYDIRQVDFCQQSKTFCFCAIFVILLKKITQKRILI